MFKVKRHHLWLIAFLGALFLLVLFGTLTLVALFRPSSVTIQQASTEEPVEVVLNYYVGLEVGEGFPLDGKVCSHDGFLFPVTVVYELTRADTGEQVLSKRYPLSFMYEPKVAMLKVAGQTTYTTTVGLTVIGIEPWLTEDGQSISTSFQDLRLHDSWAMYLDTNIPGEEELRLHQKPVIELLQFSSINVGVEETEFCFSFPVIMPPPLYDEAMDI